MENQVPQPAVNLPPPSTTPVAASTQPLAQPSLSPPTQKTTKPFLLFAIGIGALVILVFTMILLFWNTKPQLLSTGEPLPRDPEVGRVDNPPTDYAEPISIDSSELESYENNNYGFKLQYPSTWQIETSSLAQGTSYEKYPHASQPIVSTSSESSQLQTSLISVSAADSPGDVVILSKGQEWHVVVFAQKEFEPGSCGAQTYGPSDPYDPDFYTSLSVNNRKVFRPSLENGALRTGRDSSLPTPQYILAFEPATSDTGSVVRLPYCIETTNEAPLRLTITYNSPSFVASNFSFSAKSASQLDKEVLREMDFIVESIQY